MSEAWIQKTDTERIKIAISEFNDYRFIDIRLFYRDRGGEWRWTQKGVTLPLERIEDLKKAVSSI